MSLVIVPCWWDGSSQSLVESINFQRPDLFAANFSFPISLNPPHDYFSENEIPGVGELMLASFPKEVDIRKSISPISPWWIGEKYDGIRFCWNPTLKSLYLLPTLSSVLSLLPSLSPSLPLSLSPSLSLSLSLSLPLPLPLSPSPISHLPLSPSPSPSLSPSFPLSLSPSLPLSLHSPSILPLYLPLSPSPPLLPLPILFLKLQMYSRSGNIIHIPCSMQDQFPSIFVDGEIWFGRGQFSFIHSLIYESQNVSWPLLRVIMFDVPSTDRKATFEKRYSLLLYHITSDHSFSSVAMRMMCQSVKELNRATHNILSCGGEGIVLRLFSSFYLPGRNLSLLKIKAARGDAEGIIVGISKKKDISVQMPSGEVFDVPVYNVHVTRLKIGDIVTYSYEKSSQRSVPVSPKIIRIRTDLSWHGIISNSYLLDASSSKVVEHTNHAPNYWTAKKMRKFLENIAKSKNMDPQLPQTWYSISPADICLHKGGKTILQSFKGGYYQALVTLFPDLSSLLDIGKFHKLQLWGDIANRRKVFENYAKENNIDPQNWTHWSSHIHLLSLNKSANSIISNYYSNSTERALIDLFPDIQQSRGIISTKDNLRNASNQRDIVDNFAKQNHFAADNPEQWKAHTQSATKELSKVILYNNNSLPQTLQKLYPNMDTKSAFASRSRIRNRRLIFERYANKQGFDPKNAEEWYKQPIRLIASQENAKSVLKYYNGSVTKALVDLFEDINLDESKFIDHKGRNFWAEVKNRRKFFDEIAQENKFDPQISQNWTSISLTTILDRKNAGSVLRYHNGNVKQALVDIYSVS